MLKKTKTTRKSKGKHKRPRPIGATHASKEIFRLFIRDIFLRNWTLADDETEYKEGLAAFFGTTHRSVFICRVTEPFTMPGGMWRSPSRPYDIIWGIGDRDVSVGETLYVSIDDRTPDRNSIEYKDQIFVLTEAQYQVIKEKFEVVA